MLRTVKNVTQEQKKEKVEKARLFHSELIEHNGARPIDFNLKLKFMDQGEMIVGIFPSEFMKENGFYFELVDSNLDPTDSSRTVYKIPHRPNYEDVYRLLPSGSYAYPLEELQVVEKVTKIQNEKFEVDMSSLETVKDDNITNMTITDFAAIMWMKPCSQKPWLNNLILQNVLTDN